MNAKRTTDDLIHDLARRPLPPPLSVTATMGGMVPALLLPLVLFWLVFGLRQDLAEALLHLPVQAKSILPLALSVLAASLAIGSGRPGQRVALWPLAMPALAGLVLVALRLAEGPQAMLAEAVGQTALACMASIAAMSVLPLWVAMRMFRHAAPTRPALTGALLGLAVGAGVAAGYALHCTEDSPLFFMSWYVLAIATVTAAGAIAGGRVLRW